MSDKYDELAEKVWDDDEFSTHSGEYWTGTGTNRKPGKLARTRLAAILRENAGTLQDSELVKSAGGGVDKLPQSWQEAVDGIVDELLSDSCSVTMMRQIITSHLAPMIDAVSKNVRDSIIAYETACRLGVGDEYGEDGHPIDPRIVRARTALALLEKEEKHGNQD